MTRSGVLLLSHCGYSFMEELVSNVTAQELESFILSSLPLPSNQHRITELQDKSTWFSVSEHHTLTWIDLEQALHTLKEQGYRVVCCLSVWEGYRTLMAQANQRLGIADLEPRQIRLLLNKYQLRQHLQQAGLSKVKAIPLNQNTWAYLQAQAEAWFVKPVTGIASYGAFPLTPDRQWEDLEKIQAEMAADLTFRSIFSNQPEFMAEEYIRGQEFSFEILAINGSPFVIAIHEKVELNETGSVVLENACASPPLHLNAGQVQTARAWIAKIFKQLQLHWGCYHLEARYYQHRWEVIEINPRVGGALISQSVGILTQGMSMTQLWLNSLLYQEPEEQTRFIRCLEAYDVGSITHQPISTGTFFRIYFAAPGRIRKIIYQSCCLQAELMQVLLTEGTDVTESAREVFLGQALWAIPHDQINLLLPQLIFESQQAIQVDYEPQTIACSAIS